MQNRTPARTATQRRWTPLALGIALACLTTTTAQAQDPVSLGLDNAFDKAPRVCHSCALNGYDPSTYDVAGRFWYVQAAYRFQ
jgi:iron complex outermembrane receptor protein